MPPSKGSQGKQQTTLSSFFTPKQTASSTPAKPKTIPAKAAPAPVAKGEKSTNSRSLVKKAKKAAEDATDNEEQTVPSEPSQADSSDDGAPKSSMRKGRVMQAPPKSRKRDLELSDGDEVVEDGVENVAGKFTKGRKRLRRGLSNQPSGGDEEKETGKENKLQDVEMADEIPQLSKATSKFKSLSVSGLSSRKSRKEAMKEKTSQFAYSPSQEQTSSTAAVDPEYAKQKTKLREKFIQKLGKPNSMDEITRARGAAVGDDGGDEGEDGGEGTEEEEEMPKPKGKKTQGKASSAPKKGKSKLTPLEKQVVDIKMQYPDTILVVEVGYKYRFFGEDARIASKELSIMCIPGKMRFDEHPSEAHLDRFASASIPVHRLHVHVKRLVAAGHKVGVVRQLETAALKAVGDNRNAPFTRKLTNLYTKGTYVDDIDGFDDVAGVGTSAPATGYLLCLTERLAGGMGTDEKVNVGIIAVQPSTGDVIYDEFEDGFMRSEIETRLLHIAPCELLIVGELSKATEKLVTHLAGST